MSKLAQAQAPRPERITLTHVSPARNTRSLLRFGANPAYSKGKMFCVWLCTQRHVAWAEEHTKARHGVEKVIRLEISIPADELTRRKDGIYTADRVIRPEEVISWNGLRIYRGED